MIDAPGKQLSTVRRILRKHLPGAEIRVFGSRVTGKAKPYSDLDLVIMGESATDSKTLMRLKEEFEESDIPFRVDILDWHGISEEFRRVIDRKYEVIMPL